MPLGLFGGGASLFPSWPRGSSSSSILIGCSSFLRSTLFIIPTLYPLATTLIATFTRGTSVSLAMPLEFVVELHLNQIWLFHFLRFILGKQRCQENKTQNHPATDKTLHVSLQHIFCSRRRNHHGERSIVCLQSTRPQLIPGLGRQFQLMQHVVIEGLVLEACMRTGK